MATGRIIWLVVHPNNVKYWEEEGEGGSNSLALDVKFSTHGTLTLRNKQSLYLHMLEMQGWLLIQFVPMSELIMRAA